MSTALAETQTNGYHAPAIPETRALSAETLESVMVQGDLSKLTPIQKVEWYKARCDAAGLDPRAQPFQYLSLQGKLILYATKAATDQLTGIHRLSVEIVNAQLDTQGGVYIVQARAKFPDGRTVDDIGAVTVNGLKGEPLCNALMKATTKAKRRVVLSACGLGMLDETELDTMPDAHRVEVDYDAEKATRAALNHNTGHGHGKYVPKDDEAKFNTALKVFLEKVNAKWLDTWQARNGGSPLDGIKPEVLNGFQMCGHLVKWAVAAGHLDPNLSNTSTSPDERRRFAAVAYTQHKAETQAEMSRYAHEQAAKAELEFYQANPDLAEDFAYEWPEADTSPEDESQEPREPGSDG